MTDQLKLFHSLLVDCANAADEIASHYYHHLEKGVSLKDNKTLVTKADLEIEKKVQHILQHQAPEIGLFGEEFGDQSKNAPTRLIIDPIDATYNFVRKIPFFGTLIGVEQDGEIVAGVVTCPIQEERWLAAKGTGTQYYFKDRDPELCQVSTINKVDEAHVFHGCFYGFEGQDMPQEKVLALLKDTYRQRCFGDFYSHMLIAKGAGEFAIDNGLQPWDIAPIKIIVEEAGGIFTDFKGEKTIYSGSMISSNGHLHEQIVSVLSS